jgi:hypothetical protein
MTISAEFWTSNLPDVIGAYLVRRVGETQAFVTEVAETPDGLMVNLDGSPSAREFEDGWMYVFELDSEEFEWQGPLLPAEAMAADLEAVQAITQSIASGQCWTTDQCEGESESAGPISSALEEAAGRLNEENQDNLKLLIKMASQLLQLRQTVAALQDSKPGFNEAQWNAVALAMMNSDSGMKDIETILS